MSPKAADIALPRPADSATAGPALQVQGRVIDPPEPGIAGVTPTVDGRSAVIAVRAAVSARLDAVPARAEV
jgi:hypothetical protein